MVLIKIDTILQSVILIDISECSFIVKVRYKLVFDASVRIMG